MKKKFTNMLTQKITINFLGSHLDGFLQSRKQNNKKAKGPESRDLLHSEEDKGISRMVAVQGRESNRSRLEQEGGKRS